MKWRIDTRVNEYKVVVLPLAEKDILSNTDYIFYEKSSSDTAIRLIKGFRKAIEELSFMPEQHEYDEDIELTSFKIRKKIFKRYKIYFYVDNEQRKVFVLRVLHMLVDAKPLLLKTNFL